jgi:hypothetical protein
MANYGQENGYITDIVWGIPIFFGPMCRLRDSVGIMGMGVQPVLIACFLVCQGLHESKVCLLLTSSRIYLRVFMGTLIGVFLHHYA